MKKSAVIIVLVLATISTLSADDELFKAFKLSYNVSSFLDYQTTFHASRLLRFEERNVITQLYWRSPSTFCAFKSLETIAMNKLFNFVYKQNKTVGIIVVVIFAVVRIFTVFENSKVMEIR